MLKDRYFIKCLYIIYQIIKLFKAQIELSFIDGDKIPILFEFDKTMAECMAGQYDIGQFKCRNHSNVKNLISSIFNR